MIKSKYVFKIASYYLMVAVCLLNESAQSQQIDNEQTKKVDVGRDDPFAQLVRKEIPPVLATVSKTTGVEESSPELSVQTVMLKFLDAKSLKQAIDNMSSEYGSIATNEENNSLIVCDTKNALARILSEIKRADKTPQQIMIEVVILDVQLNDDTEIGINWDILSDERYDIGYRQNFTANRLRSTRETSATIGDATAFNTTGLGGSFSVISGTIRNVVHLIQQKREVEILASPRVMMVSGESASIEAVEELPYTEVIDTAAGGAAALTQTKFKMVGIQLSVVATLTDDDNILLTVDAEQNVATGESDTEVPIIDTRKADTSLLLKDGQVVIFGGLRRQEKTKEVDQIPIIADLPIVGALFKSTNTIVKNSELIIFLSPHIYKDEPIGEDAMSKYKEITDRPMLSSQKNRDATKKMLLKRIELLQNEKDKDVTKELLSHLTSLEKILSQEMQETLNSSERVLAGSGM
ncbi:MAG: type II secretion system protein GspD [Planctomycetota bacterium]